jgi:hypothetical protein
LVSLEVPAARRIVLPRGRSGPIPPIGVVHSEVPNIAAGDPARRPCLKLPIDVALPKVRRLHDMHVAIG